MLASRRLRRLTVAGLLVNLGLAAIKLAAGLLGHAYALVADAVESLTDVFASLIVWSGLKYASKPPDPDHPYGHGKAEALAGLIVAAMLMGAGGLIAFESIREIMTPHHAPAPFTLAVLVAVVIVKETMFRILRRAARAEQSTVVHVDAWHHRADAVTSIFAFIGITIALIGGPGWEPADDAAALMASGVIFYNAYKLVKAPLGELMDADAADTIGPARDVAMSVPGVRGIDKLRARRYGSHYWLDVHVEVDPQMPVSEAHAIGGRVRATLRERLPRVADALIHIEPSPAARPAAPESPTATGGR